MKKGIVYLLEEYRNEECAFKIGFTTKPIEERVKSMQTGNSDEIIVCHTVHTEHYLKLEKLLHNFYCPSHKRGEWFSITDEEALNFKNICDEKISLIKYLEKNNVFF